VVDQDGAIFAWMIIYRQAPLNLLKTAETKRLEGKQGSPSRRNQCPGLGSWFVLHSYIKDPSLQPHHASHSRPRNCAGHPL